VQYAGAVELQRRLAPHAHFAVRGTLPRTLLRQVAQATYHQVWWPQFDIQTYPVTAAPMWDPARTAYVDPKTKAPLPTWDEAIQVTHVPNAQPAHVARLGRIDARGIAHGTKDAERAIRYVTKYVTKDLTEHATPRSDPQRAHFDRLHEALSTLPCSPTCANWLLYGVQPDKAKPGLVAGRCSGKVHQRGTLGYTGRRVLLSRQWSGKTLADHRADNASWVRSILSGAPADDELPATSDNRRWAFERASPADPDVPPVAFRLMRAISERQRWHSQLLIAKAALAARPDPPTLALAA